MELLSKALMSALDNQSINKADYIGENGLLFCGSCQTPKETPFPKGNTFWDNLANRRKAVGGSIFKGLPVVCACRAETNRKLDEEQRRKDFNIRIKRLRCEGLFDNEYRDWTFANDDKRTPDISQACQNYVKNWGRMKADNIGLLFHGHVGCGKTFYACCIANALLAQCIPVLVTNFPSLIRALQANTYDTNNMEILDYLQRYELLVIDDLGAERDTSFAKELVYSVVDTRYRSGKPLIITTNLSPKDFMQTDVAYKRIYDRIIESSPITVKMVGESRRIEKARQKNKKYKDFLGF